MPSSSVPAPAAVPSAAARKQALQDQVLAQLGGRRLAGVALTMGLGKTLVGLRDMARQPAGRPLLVAAPTRAVLDAWPQEARKFGLAHLLDRVTFTTYRSLGKALAAGAFHKLYLDECHALTDAHAPGLQAHVARQGHILGLTGTPPAEDNSEKGRLVATYCPIVVDYTTDEAVLAGLLNDYRLVVHRLPLRAVRDFSYTTKTGQTYTTSERESYQYWTGRLARAEAGGTEPLPVETLRILRMRALMAYPTKGHYMRYLARQQTEKVLLFTCTQQQAEQQSPHTYHSGNKDSARNLALFNTGQIPCLACVQQLSEGVSLPDLRVGIIWHAFGNERKAAQRIGRLLRLNPEETATVHLLAYQDTVDEHWVAQALAAFDPAKISYVEAASEGLEALGLPVIG